ncbi:MAG: hypothetical protein ACLRHW_20980 [Coprobacillus cateniformis]
MTKKEIVLVTSFIICLISASVSGITLGVIKHIANPNVVSFMFISLMVIISWVISFTGDGRTDS